MNTIGSVAGETLGALEATQRNADPHVLVSMVCVYLVLIASLGARAAMSNTSQPKPVRAKGD